MDLFRQSEDAAIAANAPLAVRIRPQTLDEVIGQEDFLGAGKMLRRMIEADRLSSLVFYGPPGTGKTTLAYVIARHCDCDFHALNAASATARPTAISPASSGGASGFFTWLRTAISRAVRARRASPSLVFAQ